MTGWVPVRAIGLAFGLGAVWLLAGCGGGSSGPADVSFSGQAFSNGSSRSRAPVPLANAAVTIIRYATGDAITTATTSAGGSFGAKMAPLPPGTLLLVTATAATAGSPVTMRAIFQQPSAGAVVRVDPESTLAAVAIERIVTGGASRSVITADSAQQATEVIRSAVAASKVDLDTLDFRDAAAVDAAVTSAVGAEALVTCNTRAKVYVDGVDTGKYVPYLASNLTVGAHLFRVETPAQSSETSVTLAAGAGVWVDIKLISGGGSVPSSANYAGVMTFHINDETISSPNSGISIQPAPGFANMRLVTITIDGQNNTGLARGIHLEGAFDITATDKISGNLGFTDPTSGSKLRADYVSGVDQNGNPTIKMYTEAIHSSSLMLTFNADGTVSVTLNASADLLTGSTAGTLPPQ